jgi:hypothetical protein
VQKDAPATGVDAANNVNTLRALAAHKTAQTRNAADNCVRDVAADGPERVARVGP